MSAARPWAALALLVAIALHAAAQEPPSPRVVIGSRQAAAAEGLVLAALEPKTGALSALAALKGLANPTWVTPARDGRLLFVAGESGGTDGGRVTGVAVRTAPPSLELLGDAPSGGGSPCHLALAPDGRFLLAAHYGSGSVASISAGERGPGVVPLQVLRHEGRGADERRQAAPHAHWVGFDPSGKFALAADLGADRVFVYGFDAASGKLAAHTKPGIATAAGAGPRHLAFAPGGRHVAVSNELACTVTVYAWDAAEGSLREIQTQSTLPSDAPAGSTTSSLRYSPDGRRLYVLNRKHDSISVFAADAEGGKLSPPDIVSAGGEWPWDLAFVPGGRFLLVAAYRSDAVIVHAIDAESGRPAPTAHRLAVPKPTCVALLP